MKITEEDFDEYKTNCNFFRDICTSYNGRCELIHDGCYLDDCPFIYWLKIWEDKNELARKSKRIE